MLRSPRVNSIWTLIIEASIDEMHRLGIDLVKIWVDDLNHQAPKLSPTVYQAAISQAHQHGLRAAAHIHDLADAKAVVIAGADIVGHGVRDRPVDKSFIDLLLKNKTWYIPTININEGEYLYAENPEWLADPFFKNAISPELEKQLKDPEWRKKTLANSTRARRQVKMNIENLKRLHVAGVKIAMGTDSGAAPLRIPGLAEHLEMERMTSAGLSPLEVLRSATFEGAQMLGLNDRGCLWEGCRADFLVLQKNPLHDIQATRTLTEVWRNGDRIPH
jgi:imidazolonepropionase-like amidohydrolase